MSVFLQSISFGLAVAFMLLGMVGIIVPVLPGMLLVWFTVMIYAWVTDFVAINYYFLALFTIIALVTGTSDLWLSYLGAQRTGAGGWSIVLGVIGGIIGTIWVPLLGTVIGYGVGILLGEYVKRRDLRAALRASLGGMAGWGIATGLELGGAILILLIFVVRVLTA